MDMDLDFLKVIFEAAVLLVSVGLVLVRLGRMAEKFELLIQNQGKEITDLEKEIAVLRSVLTTVAVQKVEITQLREEVLLLRKGQEELRRGEGLIR